MRICRKPGLVSFVTLFVAVMLSPAQADEYWVAPMQAVHANFHGTRGTIARFGDSITYSGAFFVPLKYDFTNATPDELAALNWLHTYMLASCWHWQDDAVAAANGCYSGTTSAWPLQTDQAPPARNIDHWLGKLKPELAVVMWGTNDLGPMDVATYTNNMRQVIQAIKNYGTVPLLTTIPPRVGYDPKSAQFAQAMRDLAVEQQVPLIDYNQEILTRRPGTTWQGTLISTDGIHPSWNPDTAQDFSNTSLNSAGYLLRNWVTLHRIWDVRQAIMLSDPPVTHLTMRVVDIAASDVPGPQPIRLFPVPAAVGWTAAQVIYDNYAEGLTFSPGPRPMDYHYVAPPLANSRVTIHCVQNNPADPMVIDDNQQLYVTQEGSDTDPSRDNRFPYHVPRLARSAAENFLAVELDLATPAQKLGMFLPASSNSWGNGDGEYFDDQNFVLQNRSVWVSALDESGFVTYDYVSLQNSYCPFLALEWDGTHKITKVSIIHDLAENTDRCVSLMDVYAVLPPQYPVGDINHYGFVNVGDLQLLVARWGSGPNFVGPEDIGGDGFVNVGDLQLLVAHWAEHI
jgi:lysophospholipase L1-like esterase